MTAIATPPTTTPADPRAIGAAGPTAARPRRELPTSTAVPFRRLVQVEIRKFIDTRAGLGLLIAIGVVTVGAIALMLVLLPAERLTFSALATVAAVPQGVLLPVFGILAATGEWSHRTAMATFALEPRRLRVGAAKLVAAALVGTAAVLTALAVGALANVIGLVFLDGDGSWAVGGAELGGALALQLIGVVQGVAFGMALMNSVVAIVGFFVLPTLWTVLGGLVGWLEPVAPWLDLAQATAPLSTAGPYAAQDWAQLLTAVAVWVGVPLAIGGWRLARREVK